MTDVPVSLKQVFTKAKACPNVIEIFSKGYYAMLVEGSLG